MPLHDRLMMSRDQFDAALAEAIRKYPAGSHKGWVADFAALDLPGVVTRKVRMTGDPLALIAVRCRADTPGLSGPQVAQGLERFWMDDLVFRREPECHILSVTAEAVVLEGFTIHANHFVSVRITVDMSGTAEA